MNLFMLIWRQLKSNPFHSIIGFWLIGIGIFLVVNDHYFLWPPAAVTFVNNNYVGVGYILVGVGMVYWVLSKYQSIRLDHFLLIVATFGASLLTMYQLVHWFVLGIDMPWISNMALTVFILILCYRSNTQ
ncbi:hypothetical protein [Lentilactobacillus kribbianus]|uniref:hypothetical protein n=1 Tax=Lentilactobacillus kribbianus TaxID=2729622 RepID=UPI0015520FD8|nr:hypothetical protein [Lentilactobacillus kribbianus]